MIRTFCILMSVCSITHKKVTKSSLEIIILEYNKILKLQNFCTYHFRLVRKMLDFFFKE